MGLRITSSLFRSMEESDSRYENVWKLLDNYYFEINIPENIDLICVICQGILKNAYHNICGCRYCFNCVDTFCKSNERYCPGSNEGCREKFLCMDSDIHVDTVANKKLSRLVVRCPIEACQFTSEFRIMDKHIKTHQQECPYFELGCTDSRNRIENLNDHLSHETPLHSNLLIKMVKDLKEEIVAMKEMTRRDNSVRITERNTMENLIENHRKEVQDLKVFYEQGIKALSVEVDLMKANHNKSDFSCTEKSFREGSVLETLPAMKVHTTNNCLHNHNNTINVAAKESYLGKNENSKEILKSIPYRIPRKSNFGCNPNDIVEEEIRSFQNRIKQCQAYGRKMSEPRKSGDTVEDDLLSLKSKMYKMKVDFADQFNQTKKITERSNGDIRFLQKDMKRMQSTFDEKSTKQKETNVSAAENVKSAKKEIQDLQIESKKDKEILIAFTERITKNEATNLATRTKQEKLVQTLNSLSHDVEDIKAQLHNLRAFLNQKILVSDNKKIVNLPKPSDDSFEWRIEEFSEKLKDARAGNDISVHSPWFDTPEYKMTLTLYPNGDDTMTGTHLSLFLFIIKQSGNNYGSRMHRVVMSVTNQIEGTDDFQKEYVYYSFIKDEEKMASENIASSSIGSSDFIPLNLLLNDPKYFLRDTLIVKFRVGL